LSISGAGPKAKNAIKLFRPLTNNPYNKEKRTPLLTFGLKWEGKKLWGGEDIVGEGGRLNWRENAGETPVTLGGKTVPQRAAKESMKSQAHFRKQTRKERLH